jgi:UDP-N-acetylmuramoylalanine--D-glutamate ligase
MVSAAGKVPYAGGNLGDPALDLLSRPRPDYYVIELSSYQLESTETLKPAAATVLNVTADHMDRYTDLAAYAAAKERVYRRAETGVVNEDDPIVSQMKIPDGERISFGLSGNSLDFTALNDWLIVRGEKVLPLSDIRIPGLHNIANALAALALGDSIGLPVSAMTKALKEFRGLPHRMQLVAEHDGVRFVDDSKGTNVGATVAAVSGLEGPLVLVAGGDGKEQDFSPLKDAFAGKVRHAVLIGRDRELLARALRTVCSTEFAADMNDAVIAAARIARPGEIVLLSPACASLDMFRDYADRGDRFADAARRLSA